MDGYDLSKAVEPFVGFIDQLTNWYIRRSRPRFWSEVDSQDRRQAFETLYQVLLQLSKIAAPFVPFIAEAIYSNLKGTEMPPSVHLCDYPLYEPQLRDLPLEEGMAQVQAIVSLGHSLRKEHKVKVRQPLQTVFLASSDKKIVDFLESQKHLIEEELNVKEVVFSDNEDQFVHLVAKPNFRVLGKKVGKLMKAAQAAIENFTREQLWSILEGSSVEIALEGERIVLTPEDVQVERVVKEGVVAGHAEKITVALDMHLTEPLLLEGLARELKNKINTMRREAGFAVTDRIKVAIKTNDRVKQAFELHKDFITSEVLAVEVLFKDCEGTAWDLNGDPAVIALEVVCAT
jgi:isoleucyl-tRNA synthetase